VVDRRSRPALAAARGRSPIARKGLAAMSDTLLTTIARLDERLTALKERL